jgi:predicted anti-sigma-YlaC factor YlaD
MIHEEQRIRISQYVDDELDLSAEKVLFEHLTQCAECRDFLRHSVKLRSDMAASSLQAWNKSAILPEESTKASASYAYDRKPAGSNVGGRGRHSLVSTFVLLVMVTLIVGILFSANVKVQNLPGPSTEEFAQPK